MRLRLLDFLLLGIYLLLSVGGMILIKLGSKASRFSLGPPLVLELDPRMIAGLAAFFLSFLVWILIIARYELSYVMPLLVGVGQVLILAGAIVVIGERPGTMQLSGALVILVGVVMMNIRVGASS